MTTTLVVHEENSEQVYNYQSIEEMAIELPKIFDQSHNVQALTVVVCGEQDTANMTIRINNKD